MNQRYMRGLTLEGESEERLSKKVGANPEWLRTIRKRALRKCRERMNTTEL